jgi:hypothetical protein
MVEEEIKNANICRTLLLTSPPYYIVSKMASQDNSEPAQVATDISGLLPPEHWAEVAEVSMIRD